MELRMKWRSTPYLQRSSIKILVLVVMLLLHVVQAQWDLVPNRNSKRRYCGKRLSNTLDRVCGRGPTFNPNSNDLDMTTHDYFYRPPLNLRSGVDAKVRRPSGSTFRRKIRGIIQECCHNPCSVADLETYC